MKYFYQFSVILGVSLLGEFLHAILPFPFPASIYGLILMLLFLKTGLIKLNQVKETGDFLIETMPVMFIPPAVGLLTVLEEMKTMALPLVIISAATTVFVMAVTGCTAERILKKTKKSSGKETQA
ncbi:MAG: CidA/LrgA family protein [Lachnospiraceae bacterium]|nr:CidA/LrgA family protein [Lachnospiraceae bacterium]